MNDVQRIRMHPAPLFGELGNYGVVTAIKRVVAYFLPYCENISLSVSDDSIITIKCNIDIVHRSYFTNSLVVDSIKDSFGNLNEFFIFSATCESLQVNSHLDRGILTIREYKDGKFIQSSYKQLDDCSKYFIEINYKPSKDVFKYFNLISKSDLSIVSIV